MAESSKNLLLHFKQKQSEKDSVSIMEARRLVNLYRSLACFGDDFMDQYNQMLLSVKPNVRRLLRNFMGGEEVEEYLQFLEQNIHLSSEEVEQKTIKDSSQKTGYLPRPEEDIANSSTGNKITVSEQEWQQMQAQKEDLIKQTENLLQMLGKLKQTPSAEKESFYKNTSSSPSFESYSEIIEESGEKRHE